MKTKTILFMSATIGVLFATLAINLFANGAIFYVYAQDSTQQQLINIHQIIQATIQNVIPAGTERTDYFGIKQVYVPAGCFMMGSTDAQAQDAIAQFVKQAGTSQQSSTQSAVKAEQPQHQVCITNAYWLDEFDVTNATFDAFIKANGYSTNSLWSSDGLSWKQKQQITGPDTTCMQISSTPNQPRVCVSYYEAEAYAKWRTCRLPTEAEWEYAARGANGWIYPWGDSFDQSKANTHENNIGKTTAVDAYPTGKSWVGAYDMAGNVWQWVTDWYDANYYSSSAKANPTGPNSGTSRVLRGGTWGYDQFSARTANRASNNPSNHFVVFGFRVACSIPVQ